jgi:hypothetical protein
MCEGMTEKLESSPIVGIGELPLVLAYKHKCSPRIQRVATDLADALAQGCLETGR